MAHTGSMFVVGLGASAGGLDALQRFFGALGAGHNAAFVVIQHLSPDHKSMMATLLARHTPMPVQLADEGMVVEPGHVYLIPPGTTMHVAHGLLHLKPKPAYELSLPIDIFFTSMALEFGAKAVGVILSGTGSDGTKGAIAIRAAGGFVLSQDPESCKFDGMPRSAQAANAVDVIASSEELPAQLITHLQGEPLPSADDVQADSQLDPSDDGDVLTRILRLLHLATEVDFSQYKPATVMRRVERRMQALRLPALAHYLERVETDKAELLALRQEMLISVTSFFRDPDAFAELSQKVIDPLVANSSGDASIRAWVAGTATGEEAYSIAILFYEAFERHQKWPKLKIFATDIDHTAVGAAGHGSYPETIASDLSAERLSRFFHHHDGLYKVRDDLRQAIVFARHNVLQDPPFTKMDLVTCRNTLIYFKPDAQERALSAMIYSLNQGGALFLGSSETVVHFADALTVLSSRHKLFLRSVERIAPMVMSSARSSLGEHGSTSAERRRKSPVRGTTPLALERGTSKLLASFAPAAIVFNVHHEAVHIFGDINPFTQSREGSPSLAVNRVLSDALVPVASTLLHKAFKDSASLTAAPVELRSRSGDTQTVRVSAKFLSNEGEERLVMLCFEILTASPQKPLDTVDIGAETLQRIDALELELAATRDNLQSTIEELETSNEELHATNEELMASNEELQSSNEELQSVNEELHTVNAEYQEKVLLLNKLNADLDSMGKATGVATVFVDTQTNMTRFNPDATRIFKFRDTDIGRPLEDIAHTLNYPNLVADLTATMRSGIGLEREVNSSDGSKVYYLRFLPYASPASPMQGAVMSFVDVSAYHDAKRLQAILDGLPEHIAVLDPDGTIQMVNAAWRRFAIANGDPDLKATGPGAKYLEVCPMDDLEADNPAAVALRGVRSVLEGTLPFFSIEYPCHSPTEQRWFVMSVAPVPAPALGAVVSHFNITSWFSRTTKSDLN